MREYRVVGDQFQHRVPSFQVHETETLNNEATLACALIERWGMVAAKVDGEDSAQRSKLAELTPVEVVARACETAALAWEEFRKRGWTVALPTLAEVDRIIEERAAKNGDGDDENPRRRR